MYLLNLVPSKSVPKTPVELWSGRNPSMIHLHIWGCPAHKLKGKFDKLQSKTEVVFLENDYMNNYTTRSRVVLAEMNEPIIEQSIHETRDNVDVLNTPQDITHEMTST